MYPVSEVFASENLPLYTLAVPEGANDVCAGCIQVTIVSIC